MSNQITSQRHFELLAREPFGSSFLLCLKDENDTLIAQSLLKARFARVLYVLDAADAEENTEEWRGFISAEELGVRCSAFSGIDKPLEVETVRQLIHKLRKLIIREFAGVGGAPQLIETERFVGYRIVPGLLHLSRRGPTPERTDSLALKNGRQFSYSTARPFTDLPSIAYTRKAHAARSEP